MNNFEFLIRENFDEILIIALIFLMTKEGVEDTKAVFYLGLLLF